MVAQSGTATRMVLHVMLIVSSSNKILILGQVMDQNGDALVNIPSEDFEKFLDNAENKRIFFSGRFGTGKTYFLRRFFEEHKDKYDVYHLFPVNYQIASNKNIIDLIKYDILVELLKEHRDTFSNKRVDGVNDRAKIFLAYLRERWPVNRALRTIIEKGSDVLSFIPDPNAQAFQLLGRSLKDLLAVDKEFQKFKKEYLAGDKEKVERFMKMIDSNSTDSMSHLLKQKISELKEDKRSVLILDDFERIDPEHIFRILNTFSVHMEGDEENKFGFDHIITVGDMNNIESIFHHRYGEKTEFKGYFDKFFTVKPYIFDNKEAIKESLPYLLEQIKCEAFSGRTVLGNGNIIKFFLEEVLESLLDVHELNLRQIYRPIHNLFPEVRHGSYRRGHFIDEQVEQINIAVRMMIAICGSRETFLKGLGGILEESPIAESNGQQKLYYEFSSVMMRVLIDLKPESKMTFLDKTIIAKKSDTISSRVNIFLENVSDATKEYFYKVLKIYVQESKYIEKE